jgi:hypothetical protein
MTTVIAPPATHPLHAVPDLPVPADLMAQLEDADALVVALANQSRT